MGWTNSHLYQFQINDSVYGDRWLLYKIFEEMGFKDSREMTLSKILPKSGERFLFEYEYDFGDCWTHEVLFEGCLRIEPGQRYPICLEGARACPPEDVGGYSGYKEFFKAPADCDDEQHEQFAAWIGGSFDARELRSRDSDEEDAAQGCLIGARWCKRPDRTEVTTVWSDEKPLESAMPTTNTQVRSCPGRSL